MIPLVAACRELVRRGHDVVVVGDPGTARWEAALDAAVVEVDVVPIQEDTTFAAFQSAQTQRSPAERGAAAAEMFVGKSLERVPEFRAEAERFGPDVILRDYGYHTAWMVGAQLDIPVATFAYFPLSPRQYAQFFPGPFQQAFSSLGLPTDPGLLDRWLTVYGMPPTWMGDTHVPGPCHLVQPSDLPPTDQDRLVVDEILDGLPPGRPVVYATLGTAFTDDPGLWRLVFDGVAALDVTVIATLGSAADPASVETPANVRLATFVPQAALLPHCAAVIGHGGYGTIMGALRAGLPMVSLPVGASDNVLNARRLHDIGVGVALVDSGRTADDVHNALRTVLDDASFRSAAERVAAEIADLPPPEHTATLLEELAGGRRSDPPATVR